jgi:hypothetical protein
MYNNYFVYPKLLKLIKKFVGTETVFSKLPTNFLWYCERKKFMGSFVNTESVPTIFLNHLEEFAINKIIIICRNILVDRYKLTSRPSTCPSLIGIITKCSKYLLWKPGIISGVDMPCRKHNCTSVKSASFIYKTFLTIVISGSSQVVLRIPTLSR